MTAQVARGFRDPILSDRFYRGPVGRGFIEGNPDLKPETSLQFDRRRALHRRPDSTRRRRLSLPHHRSRRALRRDADAVSLPESRPRGTAGRGGRSAGNAAARIRPSRPRRKPRAAATTYRWHAARRRGAGSRLCDTPARRRRIVWRRTFDSRRLAHTTRPDRARSRRGLCHRRRRHRLASDAACGGARRDAQSPERGLSVERRSPLGLGARTPRVGDDGRGVLRQDGAIICDGKGYVCRSQGPLSHCCSLLA